MRTIRFFVLAACTVSCLSAPVFAEQVFDESFGGARNPDGWVVQGEKNGANRWTPGEPKTIWDFFRGGQGYLRLTTTGDYQRASAFYTNCLVWSTDWRLEAEIHIERGADGLAFSWVSVDIPSSEGVADPSHLLGGYGNFVGVPRGPGPYKFEDDGLGTYPETMGYAIQFLTFSNETYTGVQSDKTYGYTPPWSTNYEAVLCRSVRQWRYIKDSSFNYLDNPNFFVANGFVRFALQQSQHGTTGRFTLTWGPDNNVTTNTWIITNYPDYPAYFGVSGGTGASIAHHDVKNFKLEGDIVPEPTALFGMIMATLYVGRRRR